jgi:hypothetical protein
MAKVRPIDFAITGIALLIIGILAWLGQTAYLLVVIVFFAVEGFRIKSVEIATFQAIILCMVAGSAEAIRGVHLGTGYVLRLVGIIGSLATFSSWIFASIADRKSRKQEGEKAQTQWTRLLRAPIVAIFLVVTSLGLGSFLLPQARSYGDLLRVQRIADQVMAVQTILIIIAAALWIRALAGVVLALKARARSRRKSESDQS